MKVAHADGDKYATHVHVLCDAGRLASVIEP
jgi:hypothetical protein